MFAHTLNIIHPGGRDRDRRDTDRSTPCLQRVSGVAVPKAHNCGSGDEGDRDRPSCDREIVLREECKQEWIFLGAAHGDDDDDGE